MSDIKKENNGLGKKAKIAIAIAAIVGASAVGGYMFLGSSEPVTVSAGKVNVENRAKAKQTEVGVLDIE